MVSYDNLVLTKLCVAAVLAAQDETSFELIVVDNQSTDGTVHYLGELERHNRNNEVVLRWLTVSVVLHEEGPSGLMRK